MSVNRARGRHISSGGGGWASAESTGRCIGTDASLGDCADNERQHRDDADAPNPDG